VRNGAGRSKYSPQQGCAAAPGSRTRATDMLFSSLPFVCLFLPVVLALYFALPKSLNNVVLVAASIVFYAWDDLLALAPIGCSILINFATARALQRLDKEKRRRLIGMAIAGNLAVLIVYKYTSFLFETANELLALVSGPGLPRARLPLPLGISFFTFHVISYLVDVYRGTAQAQHSLGTFALYILNFPQMIAGPIIRYREIAHQLTSREAGFPDLDAGILRFSVGLAKKLLVADPIGAVADQVFALAGGEVSASLAWLGVLTYGLQIYYDFSGYSDMAIGLARMFGFRFPENFNYPYTANSIQAFWRRWHMTLSFWFRDYVYVPLGGNRRGEWRTAQNLGIVFLLAGIWHGASWNFVVWGLWHGLFLSLERAATVQKMLAVAGPLSRIYVLFVVAIGWVFFRAENLGQAVTIIRSLFGIGVKKALDIPLATLVSIPMWLLILLACAMSAPIWPLTKVVWCRVAGDVAGRVATDLAKTIFVAAVTLLSLASMALTQQNPFIYFRF
jgi:alginate O-acetyltransferase complex protein AlgI